MNRRAPIQKQHERAVMLDFLQWYNNNNGSAFSIYDEPDPPDALIRDGDARTWLEVTDTFYSDEWAKTELSHATPGEENHPWAGGLQVSMDARFAKRFVDNLYKKLTKNTYEHFRTMYGAGTLLVNLQYPWLSKETIDGIDNQCVSTDWNKDILCFNEVYIAYRSMNKRVFKRLEYA